MGNNAKLPNKLHNFFHNLLTKQIVLTHHFHLGQTSMSLVLHTNHNLSHVKKKNAKFRCVIGLID